MARSTKKGKRLEFLRHDSVEDIIENRTMVRRLRTDQEVKMSYDIPLHSYLIYTDGSCFDHRSNPKAGIGVCFGRSDARNISARLPGPNQTSHRAELFAVLKAVEALHLDVVLSQGTKLVYILTDSKTVVDVLNRHYPSWTQAKLSSKDGFQRVRDMVMMLQDNEIDVQFKHIPGHSGILGNEIADILAKKGAMMPESNDETFDNEDFDLMVKEILESGSDEWDVVADETLIQDSGEHDDDEGTTSGDASEIEDDCADDEEMFEDKELDEMIREELLYEDEEMDAMIAEMDREGLLP